MIMISIAAESGIKTTALKTESNQTNQMQLEKFERNNKVENCNPTKVGSFMRQ